MDDTFYTHHLSEVSQSHRVTASENICNEQGQLIASKGQCIDSRTSERLLKFKLLKPLEESIDIEQQIDADSLYLTIESFFLSDPSRSKIWQSKNDEALVKRCCQFLCEKTILRQKLTVLSLQFPSLFDKGLFGAWFGAIVFKGMAGTEDDAINAFVAGMMHDIGMLHLNPDFVESNRPLTANEWRQLQAHPIIGREILINTPDLNEDVCNAVADHHESLDATGYPAGKISNQIGPLAQFISLLDTCYSAYEKHFRPKGRSLADLEPIIQVNQNYRNNKHAEALLLIFREAGKTSGYSTPLEHISHLFDLVRQKHRYVNRFIERAWKLSEEIGYRHKEKKILGLQNILIHVQVTIVCSGVSDTRYSEWLTQAQEENNEDSYRELEDVVLILGEILHHFKRFKVALRIFLDENVNHAFADVLEKTLDALDELPAISIAEPLQGQFVVAI